LESLLVAGDHVEVITANLGLLLRDEWTKVDVELTVGDQHFSGIVESNGMWRITSTEPGVSADQLKSALEILQMVKNCSGRGSCATPKNRNP